MLLKSTKVLGLVPGHKGLGLEYLVRPKHCSLFCKLLFRTRANHGPQCVSSVLCPLKNVLHRLSPDHIKKRHSNSIWSDASTSRYLQECRDDSNAASPSVVSQHGKVATLPAKQNKKRETQLTEKRSVGEPVLQDLQSLFRMTRHEALTTVQSSEFFPVPDDTTRISEAIHTLKDFGISSKQLQRIPWILLQTAGELSSKIKLLTQPYLFQDYFDGLGFCYFTQDQILKFQELFSIEAIPHHNNRIYYIAEKLMVPVDRLTERIVKVPVDNLLTRDLYKVEDSIHLLNKYQVHPEDILNDLWFFSRANLELTEQRLSAVVDAGCKRPKLWMTRCSDKYFERALNKYQAQRDTLGDCKSVEEFLAKQFKCSVIDLKQQPGFDVIKNMRPEKLKEKIDMLLSEDFSASQILCSLRLLTYSEQRTRKRIRRLRSMGVTDIYVGSLYGTPKQFETYCLRLGEKNKAG